MPSPAPDGLFIAQQIEVMRLICPPCSAHAQMLYDAAMRLSPEGTDP